LRNRALTEFNNTIRRELSLTTFLVLEPKDNGYFSPSSPHFGPDVSAKFQTTAVFEIDEAAKCLALGRPTACVFHLMRVMEFAVRAARCVGIPDPLQPADRGGAQEDPGWIDAKWPTGAARTAGDGEFFDNLYASLDAVKNPWRNATMHPASKYTDDEAEHVFVAVKGFMMKLASHCDENGEPKA
jgi:hypothetical protein